MPLTSGSVLGAYQIISALGAGGMGEVYRARDTRLGRQVAIKVLPDALAFDGERIARFEREAKVLAALNHPHIAALHGLETANDRPFLIMELVEGETLADRIARGPLPVKEVLGIAIQIAEALEAAHEQGIVHRDLKPANIKLTPDDKVKVLDFGLARAMDSTPAATAVNVTQSPTFSLMATQAGMILGTAAYMSPEQAKGLPADHRSDVFAFGCILYAMLTGRQAFHADNVPEILAAVIMREPDFSRLPSDLDARLNDLLRRALTKERRQRWHAIADVRAQLETIAATPSPLSTGVAPAIGRAWSRPAAAAVTAAIITAAVAASVALFVAGGRPAPPVMRFSLLLPAEGQVFSGTGRNPVALSPDGLRVVYVANRALYQRALNEPGARLIPGTEVNPSHPVFSSDGSSIVFRSGDATPALMRVALTGGAPLTIAPAVDVVGIFWASDAIFFGSTEGIMRVSDRGGKTELVVPASPGERLAYPHVLADGDTLLITSEQASPRTDRDRRIVTHSLRSGVRKVLIEGGSDARWAPTGHLLYALDGRLLAAPFDPDRLEVTGAPVPVVDGLRRSGGSAWFSVASTGALLYVPGSTTAPVGGRHIAIVDRTGEVRPLGLPAGEYRRLRVSPDGRQLAFDDTSGAVWVYGLGGTAAVRRLTFEGQNRYPLWSVDNRRVTFASDRAGGAGIYWQDADGTSAAERLTTAEPETTHVPDSWSPDGGTLLFSKLSKDTYTLWTRSSNGVTAAFGGVRSSRPINAVFSPDGRWIAYSSTELGLVQVFVQPFPATGVKYQLTREPHDGHHPVWSKAGDELFLIPAPAQFGRIKLSTQPVLSFGDVMVSVQLFTGGGTGPSDVRGWDVTPEGAVVGFAASNALDTVAGDTGMHMVLNWFEELKAKVPAN
jgi:eukaryotic-like serine/threonine-protein kinase